MSADVLTAFRAAIAERCPPPDEIIADGELHRFHVVDGKPGNRDGAYLLHLDGIAAGGFQNWEDGLGWEDWCSKRKSEVPDIVWTAHLARMATDKKRREEKLAQERTEARARDERRWNAANELEPHPYYSLKGIAAHGTRVDHVDDGEAKILVPVRDLDGKLHGLQRISADKTKQFTARTAVTGNFFIIGELRIHHFAFFGLETVFCLASFSHSCGFISATLESSS